MAGERDAAPELRKVMVLIIGEPYGHVVGPTSLAGVGKVRIANWRGRTTGEGQRWRECSICCSNAKVMLRHTPPLAKPYAPIVFDILPLDLCSPNDHV